MISPGQNGLLLLNKRSGVTSFDSLGKIKKTFATGKVGHTGTLDKFASGLLLVLVGRGVKLAPLFENCTKEYTGTIFFGAETDTLDPEGKVIARGETPSREEVESALESFRGDILQSPPAYSAIHINGRRAHELSREGKEPEMKKRPCRIIELEILSWAPPEAVIRTRVSSGTYIRSLVRDIALAAGSRAHLTALNRTRVGAFSLEDAVEEDSRNFGETLLPLDRDLFNALSLPVFLIDEKTAKGFLNGKPLEGLWSNGELCLPPEGNPVFAGVFRQACPQTIPGNPSEELLGVLQRRNGKWNYGHVFRDN